MGAGDVLDLMSSVGAQLKDLAIDERRNIFDHVLWLVLLAVTGLALGFGACLIRSAVCQ